MRSDVIAPSPFRQAAPWPDSSPVRTGPVTVAVGQAVDGTLRAGAIVARHLGRGIAVISVIEPVAVYLWHTPGAPIPPNYEEERSLARWSFLEEQMRASADRHPPWSIEVLWGGVPRTVARAAHDLHAPCIVMGLGRHQPIDRFLGAETAVRTVRHADCPVLAVAHTFEALPATAVIGIDFSDASAHAVRVALPLLAPNATLHLVHVWQPADRAGVIGTPHDEQYRRELPGRFARFVAALDLPATLSLRTEIREGPPAARLLELAESEQADLIVVGRHGRGLIERLLVGSVATRVLRGARLSVLVVPEPPPGARVQFAERQGATRNDVPIGEWQSYLDAFARRFAGRFVTLESSDPTRGFHAQERGVLFGTSFDPYTEQLEILLGEPHGRRRHLTRVIPDATSVAAMLVPGGIESGVHIVHSTGDTLLTLLPITDHAIA